MSTTSPSVSIGLPVFNGEKFLRSALDALVCQTFSDFELVIADNASIDQTESICREYAARDRRIIYVRHPFNLGGASNFQYTLEMARGKYFMWAACDDWWDKEFVGTLAGLLAANPRSVIAFSRIHHVDGNGVVFREYPEILRLDPSRRDTKSYWVTNSFDAFMLQNNIHGKVNLIYGLMRREALTKARVWQRWGDFGWGGDLLAVASILRYGDVVFSTRILWKKTEHPESAGSLPPGTGKFTLLTSLRNLYGTYRQYLKYCQGLWSVQGPMGDAKPIPIVRRTAFTLFEGLRLSGFFVLSTLRAGVRRCKALRSDS